jgi:hypothetical protein
MELAKRDIMINVLKDEITCRKKVLINKVKEIHNVQTENEFLGEVASDYSRYRDYLIKEKQKQYEALQLILNYINNITKDIQTSQHILSESKYQQKMILGEIEMVKREIDELINN